MDSGKVWLLQSKLLSAFQVDQFINNSAEQIIVSNGADVNWTDYTKSMMPPPLAAAQLPSHDSRPCVAVTDGFVVAVADRLVRYNVETKEEQTLAKSDKFGSVLQVAANEAGTVILGVVEADWDKVSSIVVTARVNEGSTWKMFESDPTTWSNGFISNISIVTESCFFCVGQMAGEYSLLKGTIDTVAETVHFEELNTFSKPIKYLTHLNNEPGRAS